MNICVVARVVLLELTFVLYGHCIVRTRPSAQYSGGEPVKLHEHRFATSSNEQFPASIADISGIGQPELTVTSDFPHVLFLHIIPWSLIVSSTNLHTGNSPLLSLSRALSGHTNAPPAPHVISGRL